MTCEVNCFSYFLQRILGILNLWFYDHFCQCACYQVFTLCQGRQRPKGEPGAENGLCDPQFLQSFFPESRPSLRQNSLSLIQNILIVPRHSFILNKAYHLWFSGLSLGGNFQPRILSALEIGLTHGLKLEKPVSASPAG